jgi:hypothetical protein
VTVFAVFLLGRQIAGDWVGLIAAAWICASPSFLFQSVIPMSDVPATAAWTLALLLIFRSARHRHDTTIASAMAAGACAGAAILIRPNLAPLAAILALMLWRSHRNVVAFIAFVAPIVPAVLAIAWLNNYWYGSPFTSGYGDVSLRFSLGYFPTNLRHYAWWLWETQTPAIFLAPLAIWTAGSAPERSARTRLVLFATAVAACYVFYLPFDTWDFVRFLLPAYPALLVLTAALFIDAIKRSPWPRSIATVIVATLVGTVALSGIREARAKGIFENWQSLRRFVDIPAYARRRLPTNAIYLTRLYSGSLRHYADRPTLRWDFFTPASLSQAMAYLHEQGLVPLIVIEDGDETRDFSERFHGSCLAGLDWPAIAEYRGVQTVRIFNPDDCGRGTATAATPDRIPRSY